MAEQQNLEERFALLESRVAELERQRTVQEDRDIALLARIDTFIDDLRRIERVQMRSFEELRAGQNDQRAEFRAHQEYVTEQFDNVETNMSVLIDAAKSHKGAIEQLHEGQQAMQAGQEQILAILTGKAKTND
jgi:hypothetical protein